MNNNHTTDISSFIAAANSACCSDTSQEKGNIRFIEHKNGKSTLKNQYFMIKHICMYMYALLYALAL